MVLEMIRKKHILSVSASDSSPSDIFRSSVAANGTLHGGPSIRRMLEAMWERYLKYRVPE